MDSVIVEEAHLLALRFEAVHKTSRLDHRWQTRLRSVQCKQNLLDLASQLESLPAEVLANIAQHLRFRDISRFSRTSEHIHDVTAGYLFTHLNLNLQDAEWPITALQAVNPKRWRCVKYVNIRLDFGEALKSVTSASAASPHQTDGYASSAIRRNLWHVFFSLLPPLRKVTVHFEFRAITADQISQMLESPFWASHASLIANPTTSAPLIPTASLELNLGFVYPHQIQASWDKLTAPFRGFAGARLDIGLPTQADTADYAHVARSFPSTWCHWTSLAVGCAPKVALPFTNVCGLRLKVFDITPSDICQYLLHNRTTLATLELHDCAIPEELYSFPRLHFPKLRRIIVSGASVEPALQIVKHCDIPELSQVSASLQLDAGAGFGSAILEEAHRLVQLDDILPARCVVRQYDLYHQTDVANAECMTILAPLLARRDVTVHLELVGSPLELPTEPGNDLSDTKEYVVDFTYLTPALLATSLEPRCRSSLVSLTLVIDADCISQPVDSTSIELPHLTTLAFDVASASRIWPLHIIQQWFASITAPALESIELHGAGYWEEDPFSKWLHPAPYLLADMAESSSHRHLRLLRPTEEQQAPAGLRFSSSHL